MTSVHTHMPTVLKCISYLGLSFELQTRYLIVKLIFPLLCLKDFSFAICSWLMFFCFKSVCLPVYPFFQYPPLSILLLKPLAYESCLTYASASNPLSIYPSVLLISLPQHLLKPFPFRLFKATTLVHATIINLLNHCRNLHIGPLHLL